MAALTHCPDCDTKLIENVCPECEQDAGDWCVDCGHYAYECECCDVDLQYDQSLEF